jgi:transposase
MPSLKELAQLGKESLLVVIAELLTAFTALTKRVGELLAEIAALKSEIASLRSRLDQQTCDSKRQAAPFSKGQRKPHPKPPGRKPGVGPFTMRLAPTPDQWTEPPIHVQIPDPICPCCGERMGELRVDFASVTEMPPQPKPIVRAYRVWVYRCPSCDTTVRAPHPDLAADQFGATAHRIGPRLMAAAHLAHYGFGVTVRKTPGLLRAFTGVALTQSAITQDALRRTAGRIGAAYQELRAAVPTADVVHTDDTGWRMGGERAHLMVFVTDTVTVFQVRPQHRNEEVREVIGDAYDGVLVTDRGKSYDAKELEEVKQQKCINHGINSINEVLETKTGRARHFGSRLKKLLKEGLALWHEYHDHEGQLPGFAVRARQLEAAVSRHLRPRKLVDADNQRLLDQFGWHHRRGNLLRFLADPQVKPTNDTAERGIRSGVIQRKVSQCSKTESGAEAFAAFTSVIKTAVKKGVDALEWLYAIFRGPRPREAPS